MPSFLHNFADKAQTALNATPIGAHVQQYTDKIRSQGATSPSGAAGDAQSGQQDVSSSTKSYALENVQHQFRVLQQQYSSNTSALQRTITAQKGIAIDLEGFSRDVKAYSKEMYIWGQSEDEDVKDVTDRLAYLNFVHGSLAANYAKKLNVSRSHLKGIRDEETALSPRRNIREGINLQINKIKSDGQKGAAVERKIAELENQLKKAKEEDSDTDKQFEILKRKAIRENETEKWAAIREYAEKLILLADASTSFLDALPPHPPTPESPYVGAKATAATRASVQSSLNKWVTGHVKVPDLNSSTEGIEPDTRSFGESHASELSGIGSSDGGSSVPAAGALNTAPSPVKQPSTANQPIDANQLNQTPVQIPSQTGAEKLTTSSPPPVSGSPPPSQSSAPTTSPTVAETGVPLAAGISGPGPRHGSLSQSAPPAKAAAYGSQEAIASTTPSYPSAEDEKRRLAREERDRILNSGSSQQAPVYESAEDEKKRLERQERERVLQLGGSGGSGSGSKHGPKDGEDEGAPPPAYHD